MQIFPEFFRIPLSKLAFSWLHVCNAFVQKETKMQTTKRTAKTKIDAKAIRRDLKRLDARIALCRRRAVRYADDADAARTFRQDAKGLQKVRDAVAAGKPARAGRLAYDLDVAARDEIPKRLFNTIMKANGYC
jgi:hypothetical protein